MFAYATVRYGKGSHEISVRQAACSERARAIGGVRPQSWRQAHPRAPPRASPPTQSLPDQGGQWPGDGWWTAYNDAQLDQLIAEGLAGSPDIASAAARLARAQGVAAERRRGAGAVGRRRGERRQDQAELQFRHPARLRAQGLEGLRRRQPEVRFRPRSVGQEPRDARAPRLSDRDAARVEVAEARLTLADRDRRVLCRSRPALCRARRRRGGAAHPAGYGRSWSATASQSGLDNEGQRHQAEAAVPAARADLSQIDEQIALTRNQLAALIGAGPDRGLAIARPKLGGLVDARRCRHRPGSIWSAAAPTSSRPAPRVEAAAQRIKVAHAAFYPDISLSALVGLAGARLRQPAQVGIDLRQCRPGDQPADLRHRQARRATIASPAPTMTPPSPITTRR